MTARAGSRLPTCPMYCDGDHDPEWDANDLDGWPVRLHGNNKWPDIGPGPEPASVGLHAQQRIGEAVEPAAVRVHADCCLTPAEARRYAASILEAADMAEEGNR